MTFSGLCTLLERDAVLDVGGFAADMTTEDIDLTWRLQLAGREVAYEPRALFGMQAPVTFRAWWRQRQRWARGLAQVLRRYTTSVFRPGNWRMWGIWSQCFFSLLWAHLFLFFGLFWSSPPCSGTGRPGSPTPWRSPRASCSWPGWSKRSSGSSWTCARTRGSSA